MAQVVQGSRTLAQCQARRGSYTRALLGARCRDFFAGAGAKRPNISAWTHATRKKVPRDGRCEAASFQCHEVCNAALTRATWK
ncbi:hypothetical protein HAX54_046140, partial [Datura stramonium]|nr:hypothetical protein [Datura stramonium]